MHPQLARSELSDNADHKHLNSDIYCDLFRPVALRLEAWLVALLAFSGYGKYEMKL